MEELRGLQWFALFGWSGYHCYVTLLRMGFTSWCGAWTSGMFFYQLGFWVVALSDLIVSTYWTALLEHKLKPRLKEHNSWTRMTFVSLGNQLSQLALTWLAFWCLSSVGGRGTAIDEEMNLHWTLVLVATACGFLLYDFFFWLGHWLLHSRSLYESHKLHHSSVATWACSAHFMSPLDFLLESSGCLVACIVVQKLVLGLPDSAYAVGLSMSGFNAAIVHSGWDVWWLPSPKRHFAHHAKSNVNYGIGVMDAVMGTGSSI